MQNYKLSPIIIIKRDEGKQSNLLDQTKIYI